MLFVVGCWGVSNHRQVGAAETPPFRVGFSRSMFADINENEARAAVRAWGQTVARERDVPTSPESLVFRDTDSLVRSLRDGAVDAVGMTLPEFAVAIRTVPMSPVFVAHLSRTTTEVYYLVTRTDGPVKSVQDLAGRRVLLLQHPRMSLATLWIDTLLAEAGLPVLSQVAEATVATKLSRVVLPVFFRQADACLVTQKGFATMAELNPQVGAQLRPIAVSPEFVASVFAFRAAYSPPYLDRLLDGVRRLHETPAGQQVLTIFQSDRIEDQPLTSLNSALDLIATHARLCGPGSAGGGGKGITSPATVATGSGSGGEPR